MEQKSETLGGLLLSAGALALLIGIILASIGKQNLFILALILIIVGALCFVSGIVYLAVYILQSKEQKAIEKEENSAATNKVNLPSNPEERTKIIKKIKKRLINYAIDGKQLEQKNINIIRNEFVPKYDPYIFNEAVNQLIAENKIKLIDNNTYIGTDSLSKEKEKRKYNVITTIGLVILVAGIIEAIRFTPTEFAVGMLFIGIGATTLIVSFIMRRKN